MCSCIKYVFTLVVVVAAAAVAWIAALARTHSKVLRLDFNE